MRPKLLTMKAFGPYGGEQIIDFTLLEDNNMFLIHGPTGAGKTTILDAICYALYGYTNGGERSAESMRSKFAKEDEPAEVELVFTLRGDEYKVIRSPKFERPKKRGEGVTVEEGKVLLYKLQEEEFVLIGAKAQEVDRKIQELLVFNVEQFRQVIMIAQNKFRELLLADSKERQKILQDIFETGLYQDVEKLLEAQNSALTDTLKEQKMQYDHMLLRLVQVDERLEPYIQTKVLKNAPEVLVLLRELEAQNQEATKQLGGELVSIKKELETLQKELLIHNENYKAKLKYNQLLEKQQSLLEETAYYEQLAIRLGKMQKVLTLIPIERQYKLTQKGIEETQVELQRLDEAEVQDQLILNTLISEEEKSKEVPKQIEILKNEYRQLESFTPKITELTQLTRMKVELEGQYKEKEDQKKKLLELVENYQKRDAEIELKLAEKDQVQEKLSQMQVKVQKVEHVLERKLEKDQKEKERTKLRDAYKKLSQEILTLKAEESTLKLAYDELVNHWIGGQAGMLAEKLEEGLPCPVCGSLSHPQKATKGEKLVSMEEIKKVEKTKHELIAQISKKEEEQVQIMQLGTRLSEEIKVIEERIAQVYEGEELEAINQDYQNQLKAHIKATEEHLQLLVKMEKEKASYKTALVESMEELEKLKERLHELHVTLERHIGRIHTLNEEVPENLRDEQQLVAQMNRIKSQYEALEQSQEKLKDQLAQIREKLSRYKGIKEAKMLSLEKQKEQRDALKEQFEVGLKAQNIGEKEEYEALKVESEQLTTLEEKLKTYQTEKAITHNGLEEVKEKAMSFNEAEWEKLKEQNQAFEEQREAIHKKQTNVSIREQLLKEAIEVIAKLYEVSETVAHKQYVIGTMAGLAKGKNSKGLSFERYIQSSIFDEVLESANEKLRPMTGSRYELYRTDELRRKNAQAGLDIAVTDNYVGQTRPVNTLSGGESFMAALALALGLADVISRLAGASSLETMFIDEGFGTLDEEALEQAIKILLNLQDKGRLVGVISHVKELREQIPARLEITSTQTGSHAAFKL